MEPMLEMFLFETNQNLEQLEQITISSEKNSSFSTEEINTIFRIMHTLKGSAAMMLVNEVATLAHAVEDIFFYLREKKPETVDCSTLTDIVLQASDFVQEELAKLEAGDKPDGSATELIAQTKVYLSELKAANGDDKNSVVDTPKKKNQQYYIGAEQKKTENKEGLNGYHATIMYLEDCEMENVRAYALLNSLQDEFSDIRTVPENVLDEDSMEHIHNEGLQLWFKTDKDYEAVDKILQNTIYLRELKLEQLKDTGEVWAEKKLVVKEVKLDDVPIKPVLAKKKEGTDGGASHQQTMISVNVSKLNVLMDLVGELVIAEDMVTHNPELAGLELNSFYKSARQLKKIVTELQDGVMSVRMVPLAATFQKMNRVVRDMCKKLDKQVDLVLVGEDTEVDKNVIEHISDPLMHLIRNSVDHGIEMPDKRVDSGKQARGKVTLEAKSVGNEVLIYIIDDGNGLDREKILKRARDNDLLYKPEADLTDREIYEFIFHAGFSTNEKVTEFSGRGVGMDVVVKNINAIGGTVLVDSTPGMGSVFTLKIPLTLAIMAGMNLRIGSASYTVPITSVRESFKPLPQNIVVDPDGSEMIMVRGVCYPIVRLHKLFGIKDALTELTAGIIIMVETDKMTMGLFVDQLVGQQQIVVKPLPAYIKKTKDIMGLSGCTLLGDGSISLIIDAAGLAAKI